jgi:hypothetical protein
VKIATGGKLLALLTSINSTPWLCGACEGR